MTKNKTPWTNVTLSPKEIILMAVILAALISMGYLTFTRTANPIQTNSTKSVIMPPPAPSPQAATGSTQDIISELTKSVEVEDKTADAANAAESSNAEPNENVYNQIGDSLNEAAY